MVFTSIFSGGRMDSLMDTISKIKTYINSQIFGQDYVIEAALIALISNEHVLLEGLPGVGKTTTVTLLAKCVEGLKVERIQFTPDLQPTDLIGSLAIDADGKFYHRKGKIYCHILIADEINRAPSKVQSALLEVMQERKISRVDLTMEEVKNENLAKLLKPNEDDIFVVFATQNPIEQEGTFPLAEASLDRFLFKIKVDYPDSQSTKRIIEKEIKKKSESENIPKITISDIKELRNRAEGISFPEELINYVNKLCRYTFEKPAYFEYECSGLYNSPIYNYIAIGSSPRAFYSMVKASRVYALLSNKKTVTLSDIKNVAANVLRHRIKLNFEGINQGVDTDCIVEELLENIKI